MTCGTHERIYGLDSRSRICPHGRCGLMPLLGEAFDARKKGERRRQDGLMWARPWFIDKRHGQFFVCPPLLKASRLSCRHRDGVAAVHIEAWET